jgi:hypothetical protein
MFKKFLGKFGVRFGEREYRLPEVFGDIFGFVPFRNIGLYE